MLYTIRYVLHLLLQVRVMTCISGDHIAGGTRGPSDYQQLSSKLWLITPACHTTSGKFCLDTKPQSTPELVELVTLDDQLFNPGSIMVPVCMSIAWLTAVEKE